MEQIPPDPENHNQMKKIGGLSLGQTVAGGKGEEGGIQGQRRSKSLRKYSQNRGGGEMGGGTKKFEEVGAVSILG